MNLGKWIKTYLGFAILGGAIVFAIVRVAYNQLTYESPDVTTIRICHWQLESGFREALQEDHAQREVGHERRVVRDAVEGRQVRVVLVNPVLARPRQENEVVPVDLHGRVHEGLTHLSQTDWSLPFILYIFPDGPPRSLM